MRYQLRDGYSDDVIRALGELNRVPATKIIVLLTASASSSIEARQLEIGADCVQRDPVRAEVLLAYLDKYLQPPSTTVTVASAREVSFARATLNSLDRTLQYHERTIFLTPREVTLMELLVGAAGEVVTYETLYSEILGRPFRGDTSNMRVLLGKLGASLKHLGLLLNECIDVIPKTGYRYHLPFAKSLRRVSPRPSLR